MKSALSVTVTYHSGPKTFLGDIHDDDNTVRGGPVWKTILDILWVRKREADAIRGAK